MARTILAALAAFALLPLAALPTRADADEDLKTCSASLSDAIDACTRLLQQPDQSDHDLAKIFYNRGFAYIELGQYARAIKDYDEVIHLNPDKVIVWNTEVIHEPLYKSARYFRGFAYYHLGQYASAIKDFDELIRLTPNDANSFVNRCSARAAWGRELDAALADCTEALRLQPNDEIAMDWRCLVYFRKGDYSHAKADCSSVLAQDPKDGQSFYIRGLAKRKRGDKKGGDDDIAAAKAIDPKIAEIFAGYGVTP